MVVISTSSLPWLVRGGWLWTLLLMETTGTSAFFKPFFHKIASATGKKTDNDLLLTERQIQAFERDGFIVLRGLFSSEEIDNMTAAGKALVSMSHKGQFQTFSVVKKNVIYGSMDLRSRSSPTKNGTTTLANGTTTITNDHILPEQDAVVKEMIVKTFRQVALRSKLPQICAELMGLNRTTQCLRCIRDVFLSKYVSMDETCDWHVDDQSFWPESFLSSSASAQDSTGTKPDQNGINVWIAMDDYSRVHGGSMIVSQGSHKAPWRHEAYLSLGQNRSEEGGSASIEETVRKFADPNYYGTCALDMSNPRIRALVERNKVEFDHLRKGDCIFATRLCFHRTSRVTKRGIEHYGKQGKNLLHRYSVRYVLGSARLPPGQLNEPSVLFFPDNAGTSLDEICCGSSNSDDRQHSSRRQSPEFNAQQYCWCPKLWPDIEENIDEKLNDIERHAMPIVKVRAQATMQELVKLMEKYNITFGRT